MLKFACIMKYFIHLRGLRRPSLLTLRDLKLLPQLQKLLDADLGEAPDSKEEVDDMEAAGEEKQDEDMPSLLADLFEDDEQESQDMMGEGPIDDILADTTTATDPKRRRVY